MWKINLKQIIRVQLKQSNINLNGETNNQVNGMPFYVIIQI